MTKEIFVQYKDICAELEDLERGETHIVSDTVSGSDEEFPFTKHSITIRGIVPDRNIIRIQKLRQRKKEIEDFAETVSPDRKRRLLRCVMKYGCRWNIVRRAMKEGKSANAVRMEFERVFKQEKS